MNQIHTIRNRIVLINSLILVIGYLGQAFDCLPYKLVVWSLLKEIESIDNRTVLVKKHFFFKRWRKLIKHYLLVNLWEQLIKIILQEGPQIQSQFFIKIALFFELLQRLQLCGEIFSALHLFCEDRGQCSDNSWIETDTKSHPDNSQQNLISIISTKITVANCGKCLEWPINTMQILIELARINKFRMSTLLISILVDPGVYCHIIKLRGHVKEAWNQMNWKQRS